MRQFRLAFFLLPLFLSGLTANVVAAEPVIVIIKKMQFQPQQVEVKKGGMVRWENREYRQYHSVWFEQLGEPEPDYLFPGDSYERKFETVGDFPYRCGPHPEMTGVVHVTE